MASSRSPLRYPGGKFRARKVLDSFLPAGVSTVLSPFVGGGSYELHLTSRGVRVTGYDVFVPLVNFWEVLLSSPGEVAEEVERLRPMGREAFRAFQKDLSKQDGVSGVPAAAKFFAVNRASFSGATLSGGYSAVAERERLTDSAVERVRTFHNPLLSVRRGDFTDTVRGGFDLVFADPPYWLEGAANKLYGVAGSLHEDFDHEKFYEAITAVESPWLVTYNDCEQVRELYADFTVTPVGWAYGMNASKKSSEVIIRNY